MDLDSFKAQFSTNGVIDRSRLNFFTSHRENPDERVFVFYSMERNVGVKTMRQFINVLEEKNITRGIIIWSDKMTSAAKKVIEAMRLQLVLEDFEEAFLLVNITHHQLVPKHEVLTPEEKKDLLQRLYVLRTRKGNPVLTYACPLANLLLVLFYCTSHYSRLKESQLPRIQQVDPVARYFGLTRGQVVKITRRTYYYRTEQGTDTRYSVRD